MLCSLRQNKSTTATLSDRIGKDSYGDGAEQKQTGLTAPLKKNQLGIQSTSCTLCMLLYLLSCRDQSCSPVGDTGEV